MSQNSFRYPIQVRFCDVDALGHVNNAHYLSYFEMARVLFMDEQIGKYWDWVNRGMVLKQNTVEYLIPVYLNEKVEVEIIPISCGNTSFVLDYQLFADGKLKSRGSSVLVCFDFSKNEKNKVYDEFKRLFSTI
jgi:acyl-CoA thioester hydrolase